MEKCILCLSTAISCTCFVLLPRFTGNVGMIGLQINGESYYYVRNMQGDVNSIIDENGEVVVNYVYDTWGKVISVSGTLADTVGEQNPIRYRGCYYDTETGLYYLNSRYYDPETGRFVSADVQTEAGNLYAYCQNDPVNRSDESGYLSKKWKRIIAIAAIAVAVVVAITVVTVATGGLASPVLAGALIGGAVNTGISIGAQEVTSGEIDWGQVAVDGIFGMLFGAVGGTAIGGVGMSISNGVLGFGNSIVSDWISDDEINWVQAIASGVVSTYIGAKSTGAQNGLTDSRQAAIAARKQINQRYKNGGYKTKNNYLFGKGSNAMRIKKVSAVLRKGAFYNLVKDVESSLDISLIQALLFA